MSSMLNLNCKDFIEKVFAVTTCECGQAVLLPGLPLDCLSVLVELSEVFFTVGLVLVRLKFPSRIHSCCKPSSGVMRLVGSQLKNTVEVKVSNHFLL